MQDRDHPSRPAQERGHLRMTVTVWCRWCKAQEDTVFRLIPITPKRAARSGQPAKDHEISEAVGPSLLPADNAGRRSAAIGANGVSVLVVLIVRAISGIGGLVAIVAVAAVIAVVITISAVSAYAKSADEVSVAMPTAVRGMSGHCAGGHCREAAANGVTLESATVDCADASAPESTGVGAMEGTDAAAMEGSCATAVETTTTPPPWPPTAPPPPWPPKAIAPVVIVVARATAIAPAISCFLIITSFTSHQPSIGQTTASEANWLRPGRPKPAQLFVMNERLFDACGPPALAPDASSIRPPPPPSLSFSHPSPHPLFFLPQNPSQAFRRFNARTSCVMPVGGLRLPDHGRTLDKIAVG